MPSLLELNVSEIHADPNNPRERFPQEELDRLAESIDQVGILVPVVVYPEDGGYRLLDGERRWRCAQILGHPTIPAVVVSPPDEASRLQQMFNIHLVREQWQDIPTAHALKKLIDETKVTSPSQLSAMTGISTQQVNRYLFALSLSGDVWAAVESGQVPLNYFYEVYKAFIQPLESDRPAIFAKYGRDQLLKNFLDKRSSGAISDVVSVRDAKYIIRKAAEDDPDNTKPGPLDDTISRLIDDPELSVKDAYEETVMVSIEADKLEQRADNLVAAFVRLLDKAKTDVDATSQIKGVANGLIAKLTALL
ncbi:ParB/RepB/Spo0J family partition protein [Solilutibacter tolerans]|uniref:ParB/RepB/Spo0J family partition protein n=1 Tax=Solilutibacter tolerans TaxID=1604334 RepID=A0A1N6XB57_9GAMM|nr:ParB/RepB/Spo0J family partition protein [Lysobacter tolerans]SIQ99594.1 ParB/RepB/Spo0J family partition protein [Lysobacter tolerans]